MKFTIIVAASVLALAGAAGAQVTVEGQQWSVVPRQAFGPPPVQPLGSHWTNPQLWDGYDDPGRPLPSR